jgi:hypothetical protein
MGLVYETLCSFVLLGTPDYGQVRCSEVRNLKREVLTRTDVGLHIFLYILRSRHNEGTNTHVESCYMFLCITSTPVGT